MTLATVRALGRSGPPAGDLPGHGAASVRRVPAHDRPRRHARPPARRGRSRAGHGHDPRRCGRAGPARRVSSGAALPHRDAGRARGLRARRAGAQQRLQGRCGRPRLAVLRRPAQAAALFRARGAAAGGERRARADARHRRRGAVTTPPRCALSACRLRIGRRGGGPLGACGFAYLPLRAICPELEALFHLRPLLGLRSPVNSLARELNPFQAPHQIQGVFHPTYLPLHGETAQRLGQAHAVIFKGGGGEAQRNPDKPCRAATVDDGVTARRSGRR